MTLEQVQLTKEWARTDLALGRPVDIEALLEAIESLQEEVADAAVTEEQAAEDLEKTEQRLENLVEVVEKAAADLEAMTRCTKERREALIDELLKACRSLD